MSSLVPNTYVSEAIMKPTSDMEASSDDPRAELDSHDNMVFLRLNSFVLDAAGRTFNVQPFSIDLGMARNVPIADGGLACDCPFIGKVNVLVLRNALHVPSVDHNLIPPFTMRAGGITINDSLKIHCEDPIVDDHCVLFDQSHLRTPLQLNVMFSSFT